MGKVAGNNNLIMGFDEGEKINFPKTLLKGDIRDYTSSKPYRIIGIMIKNTSDKLYNEITYIAQNVKPSRFMTNKELEKIINIEN